MTTNTRELIERSYEAGFEAGMVAANRKMTYMASISEAYTTSVIDEQISAASSAVASARRKRSAKTSTKAAVAPKAAGPVVTARGVKTATGPRTKGVKEAIVNLITEQQMTVAEIIARTTFKPTSIRATLMSLKKKGLASQDAKGWFAGSPGNAGNGNSEADHADVF
jgi:hypothetical protein